MKKYELTKKAKEDLNDIWNYTVDTWSEKQADKYYKELISAFRKIAAIPLRFGNDYSEILDGLRARHVGHHMVFYLRREDNTVLIVRILHERMDYKRHF